ncbi:hemerythrin domain-containing protein [Pseudoduganella sp.]|uniref:hemerythrin domain-containing protein n=1 Tax=Pseudoduganella sp. TaxID=1880898 RepID=UPI0035AEFA13
MKVQRFEHDHHEILEGIRQLRKLVASGIEQNAGPITQLLRTMSASIKLHLAVEDRVVYPAFANSGHNDLAALGRFYQQEMGDLAQKYMAFATRWTLPHRLQADPAGFRAEANSVFKALFLRTKREESELYPAFARL